ncbi:MAG TPA: isoprenylcysteine carboxylmethyltransferase family protein [Candidatus Binataceae bacterium]|nr:isoprenylcysteine carboxylmethyltransferase family protein [Candidatus Binataceae bacterium]
MSDASESAPPPPSKSTGPLPEPPVTTAPAEIPQFPLEPIAPNLPDRNFFLRLGELLIFLVAVVGAVALGLAITSYFRAHTYIAAYLLAYAGFRCADLLVREEYGPNPVRDALSQRIADQAPLLLLFFAAPFERTYLYGGEAPRWISGLALALELAGLWIALGARIQLGFFAWERRDGVEQRVLVRRGFYRFIRHPVYAGIYLALIAWPIAYGAPISAVLTAVIVAMVLNRLIKEEEELLLARYGDEYRQYRDESDAMIPNLW